VEQGGATRPHGSSNKTLRQKKNSPSHLTYSGLLGGTHRNARTSCPRRRLPMALFLSMAVREIRGT
jgi:hypothetical protein